MDIISYGLASEAQTKAIQAETKAADNKRRIDDVDVAIQTVIGNHEIRITGLRNDMTIVDEELTKMERKQATKLEIVAPHITKLTVRETLDFNTAPVEVLKLQGSLSEAQDNVVKSISTFDNTQASDFVTDSLVIFDGEMKLKTSEISNTTVTSNDLFGNQTTVFQVPLSKPSYAKFMHTIEVR